MSIFSNMAARLIAQDAAIRRAEESRAAEAERVAAANYETGKALGHLFAQEIAHISHLRTLAGMEYRPGAALELLVTTKRVGFPGGREQSLADEMAYKLGAPTLKAENLFGEEAPAIGRDHLKGFIAAVLDDWNAVQAEVEAQR